MPQERILAELRKMAGTQFDPQVVDCFFDLHLTGDINDL